MILLLFSYVLEKVLGSGGFGFIYVVSEGGSTSKAVMKVVSGCLNYFYIIYYMRRHRVNV